MNDIQRIVLDIVHQCERQRVVVPETLAAFVAKAVILENTERFQLERKLFKSDVDELISMSVQRLLEKDSPSLETLKLQVAFDSAYVQQHDALEQERIAAAKLYSLDEKTACTTQAQSARDVQSFNKIQEALISSLLLRTNQDPTDSMLRREVAAALESVLPRSNLFVFSELSFLEKKARVLDLHDYVLGIRLFNLRLGKGGAGLSNAPADALTEVENIALPLADELVAVEAETAELADVIGWAAKLGAEAATARAIPVERLQQELVHRRQYQEEIGQALLTARQTLEDYDMELESVQELVSRRAAVPKETVYPKFAALAKSWSAASDMVRRLKALRSIWTQLLTHKIPAFTTALTDAMIVKARKGEPKESAEEEVKDEGEEEALEEERLEMDDGRPESAAAKQPEVIVPVATHELGDQDDTVPHRVTRESHPDVASLLPEYNGYCPVTFVDRDWLLLPGDPVIGSTFFRGKLYNFMDGECMRKFMSDPVRYLEAIVFRAHSHTELINLLNIDDFPTVVLRNVLAGLGESAEEDEAPTQDAGCQTVTHLVESNLDYKYDFNEWSLRRKALQLTNMRNKRTHSCQTVESHFRRENEAQTWLPKAKGTMTASTTGTAAIRKLRYHAGLRGHPDQITSVVYQEIELPFR